MAPRRALIPDPPTLTLCGLAGPTGALWQSPQFYRCRACDAFHHVDFDGPCSDELLCFTQAQLDQLYHSNNNWQEVDDPMEWDEEYFA